MNIWIVTTGSSDVQLDNIGNWRALKKKKKVKMPRFDDPALPESNHDNKKYAKAPGRVLGILYGDPIEHYEDLVFPLLESFSKKLLEAGGENVLDRIILVFSDQSEIFPDDDRFEDSPYWQDTITLEFLLKKYLEEKFPKADLQKLILDPDPEAGDKGLDHWDSTLKLVQKKIEDLKISKNDSIYVSHQAGTPAMSSAIQFTTLGLFGEKVKFVVSNETSQEAEIIEGSEYLRGIHIQQAKSLIVNSNPGAAQTLLEKVEKIDRNAIAKLEEMVKIFNLNRTLENNEKELDIPAATQRIVDALDLVGIFFSQKSYLSGIALLASAQETFLKVAILSKVATISDTISLNSDIVSASSLVKWTKQGLCVSEKVHQANNTDKDEFIKVLKFPSPKDNKYKYFNPKKPNLGLNNYPMFSWLKNLMPDYKFWDSLIWSCKEKEEKKQYDDDVRNQLLHNLCGLKEEDVVKYLLGNQDSTMAASKAYNEKVKNQFLKAIQELGLPYDKDKKNKLKKRLEKIASAIF